VVGVRVGGGWDGIGLVLKFAKGFVHGDRMECQLLDGMQGM
jgi:hypothetical protein